MRTCVVCGNRGTKYDLIRLASDTNGQVRIDVSSKLPGRGAYICKNNHNPPDQLEKRKFERALRQGISEAEWTKLIMQLSSK